MARHELCFLVLTLVYFAAGLRPGGKNVVTKWQVYYTSEKTSKPEKRSRQTCSRTCRGWNIWGNCVGGYSQVCRNVYRTVYVTKYKAVRRSRPIYECKPGWRPNGDECTTPICIGKCENGGACIAPNNCKCTKYWKGSRCRIDVDECRTSQNTCSYKPGCRNLHGKGFRCTCRIGYHLARDTRTCIDNNECLSGNNTCGNNTNCVNNPGNYSCPCNVGFTPVSNLTNTCTDIDECDPGSGIFHGCQGPCLNFIGSYNCTCPKGYYLASNGKDCTDHDECAGNIHGCQQVCINYLGGYNCTCRSGYRLNTTDFKSCYDVDECAERIAGCYHSCTNLIGSYQCSCNSGYYLGRDQKSCKDIDECSIETHKCEHNCLNLKGSYQCTCRKGFDLSRNERSCKGRPCIPIFTSRNGEKNCSGYTTEHVCHFDCLPGYNITGSRNRICNANKTWTGIKTSCNIIHCPTPTAPMNGFIYHPCNTEFNSRCSIGCSSAYYIQGANRIACKANGQWEPNNETVCKEILVCEPNPCLHGGNCSPVSSTEYSCNCANTGYEGAKCEVGRVITPKYTALTIGVSGQTLHFQSSQPDNYIILTPRCYGVTFEPSTLMFTNMSSLQRSLAITVRQSGLYSIKYTLAGPSVGDFQGPEASVVFVRFESRNHTKGRLPLPKTFPTGCYNQTLVKCPNQNDVIIASSTSPWKTLGPLASTDGVISFATGRNNFPWSLSGISFARSRDPLSKQTHCNSPKNIYSTEDLLQSHVFTKTFLDNVQDSFPKWLNVKLRDSSSYPPDLKSTIIYGRNIQNTEVGNGQLVNENTYFSMLSTRNINLTIQEDTNLLRSHDNPAECLIAVDLCNLSPKNIILLPSKLDMHFINSISVVQKLKKSGWMFTFQSVQISKSKTIDKLEKGTYWNGKELFKADSPKGNMAIVTTLSKSFISSDFVTSHIQFDGTVVGDFGDLDSMLDNPLDEEWKMDMYGNMKLTMEFQVLGKMSNVTLKAPRSLSYAVLGGDTRGKCGSGTTHRPRGLFISKTLKEESPFIHSELNNFVKLGENKTISAFLEIGMYLNKVNYSNQTLPTHGEINQGVSMIFRGDLKFGALQFHDVDIQLRLRNKVCPNELSIQLQKTGIEFDAKYHSISQKFGIFKTTADVPLNLRIKIAENKNGSYMGSFQSVVKLLGFQKQVNVSFSRSGSTFNTSGKVHGLYNAQVTCTAAGLASWESQTFVADGEFQEHSDDIIHSMSEALNRYAITSHNKAKKREESSRQTERRAKLRLEKAELFMRQTNEKMMRSHKAHDIAKRSLAVAEKHLNYIDRKARNYSKLVDKLRSEIEDLCQIKHCRAICQEGVACSTCYHDIKSKVMGSCFATCHKTQQERIPPFEETAWCQEEKCKRIHSTLGIFKKVFGETLGGIVKSVVTYVATTVVSAVYSPVAGAFVRGAIEFLDTGRPQDFACGTINGLVNNAIDADLPKETTLVEDTAVFLHKESRERITSCETRQRKGNWDCRDIMVECIKGRFEYKYHHIPYTCERPCEKFVVSETIQKSCCLTVSCALYTVNITCVAENALCKKIRKEVLRKLAKTKANSTSLLQRLETARENVSYWRIKERKGLTRLLSATNSHNVSQSVFQSLQKAHNTTLQARARISQILEKPLKLQALLDKHQQKIMHVKLEKIRFRTAITIKDESKLLPIHITFKINEITRGLSTVLDFKNLNVSFTSIAKEILSSYTGDLSSFSRKKRSTKSNPSLSFNASIDENSPDHKLSILKTYHKLCTKLSNHEQAIFEIATTLYDVSSDAKQLLSNVERKNESSLLNTTSLLERFGVNETMASKFGVPTGDSKYLEVLETDPELIEAKELQDDALELAFEPLRLSSELLFRKWYAAMENVFSKLGIKCSGFDDCLKYTIDSISEVYESIDLPGSSKIHKQIKEVESEIFNLTESVDLSIHAAAEISSNILRILKDMRDVKIFCASAPNITKHPEAFTTMRVGETLALSCNATGDSLVYTWRLNKVILDNQTNNILLIKNTTPLHTGNYTCEVSNHIAKETSTPALVMIHSPPSITVQPVTHLSAVLSEDYSIRCQAKSSDKNITYQWWFRSVNTSSFVSLSNQTFSRLNFVPVKENHEGWYFCNVSNPYGYIISKTSFVKVLYFSLPVPAAKLSLTVIRESPENETAMPHRNGTSYDDVSSKIVALISTHVGKLFDTPEEHIKELHPSECRAVKLNSDGVRTTEICTWKFHFIGTNTTSESTVSDEFQINADKVINATIEIKDVIGELKNATNSGVMSFILDNKKYSVEKHSLDVEDVSLLCPKSQILIKDDFKCVDCPPGLYGELENGKATCKLCPVGFYQINSGQTSCTKCQEGHTTIGQGSYDKNQCKAKVICPAGHYGMITAEKIGQCVKCPLGMYQPMKGQFNCRPCPRGHVTAEKGALEFSKCIFEERTKPTSAQTSKAGGTTFSSKKSITAHQTETNNGPLIGGVSGAGLVAMIGFFVIFILIWRKRQAGNLHVKNSTEKQPNEKRNVIQNPVFEGTPGFHCEILEMEEHGEDHPKSFGNVLYGGTEDMEGDLISQN